MPDPDQRFFDKIVTSQRRECGSYVLPGPLAEKQQHMGVLLIAEVHRDEVTP